MRMTGDTTTDHRDQRHAAAATQDTSPDGAAALLRLAHRPIGFLLRYVRRRAVSFAAVLGAVLAAVACAVGTNWAVKRLVDAVAGGPGIEEGTAAVWAAFAVLAAVLAADNLLWRVGGWVAASAFPAVTADMRADLFHHLGGHAPSYFASRSAGVLASRVTATANAAYTSLHNFTWHALPPAVAVLCAIALLANVDPLMAIALVLAATALGLVIARLAARGQGLHTAYAERAAAVDGEVVDVVQNIGLVRAFAAFGRERRRFARVVGTEVAARQRSLRYLEKLRLLHAVATAVLTAALLAWVVTLWEAGRATTGDIVLVCSLAFTILHASRDLAVALVDLTQYVARLAEALATLLVPHALTDAPGARPLRPIGGRVEFCGVEFAYPGDNPAVPVLRGLDLVVRPGERVGLVGRSGAGKSTALMLLQRFAAPQEGRILIDGQDIAGMTQESLARAIAVVPQDVPLLRRSVMANIRYGRPGATDAEVMAVAEAACCRDFVEALPEGFDTVVGDRGTRLSGGQRQRIAIARALLKDAPILLLDEATSALDSESEAAVQRALDRLMRGRTVIAVAHRLATLSGFDRIVVMQDGRVVDDGAPGELARRPGIYRDLLGRQTLTLEAA
jgi:ATP-binding cassette subfamily B protein